jgi:iron(III) transport system substrate-binding protein
MTEPCRPDCDRDPDRGTDRFQFRFRADRRRALRVLASLPLASWPLVAGGLGCGSKGQGQGQGNGRGSNQGTRTVVVYSALDREFAEPVLDEYKRATGVMIRSKFDVESTKTVGLTNLIAEEADSPRCDLFWNNEVLNTLRLKRKGLLQPFKPANAAGYPDVFKASDGTWYGFAARGRILLVNTTLVPESDRPAGILDLIAPKWRGKVAIAKPLFGTTATHAACLFAAWGPDRAKAYFRGLKANGVQVLSGNKQVAQAVASGEAAVGLTDTDDAMVEREEGRPVAIVYPDRKAGGLGTLFIPNTLAVVKNAAHAADAEALAGFLLSPAVETLLARGPSAQIPLNPAVTEPARVETPKTVHPMAADWDAAVSHWDAAAEFLASEFAG